jgi:hypothetical protein
LGTNLEELHTPTLTPKKLERDNGDKNKLELNTMLYKNKAYQEVNNVF